MTNLQFILCGTCGRSLIVTEALQDICGETYRWTKEMQCPECDTDTSYPRIVIHEKRKERKWYHGLRKLLEA